MEGGGEQAAGGAFGAAALPRIAAGALLVASPALRDPHFFRTVVLLLESGEDSGALGLVLNRPASAPVTAVLPGWADAASPPGRMHVGGPVSPSSAIALGSLQPGAGADGFAALRGGDGEALPWGTVDLERDPALLVPVLGALRVFVGYAGWGAEQLADEVAGGAWYVLAADPVDPFTARPDLLWAAVLARQGGPLARVATMPADPGLN